MDQFRQNMRWLRNRNHLSQEAFGNLFGLTRGQIDTYERGKAALSIEDANKICKHYGIMLDQLYNQNLADELKEGSNVAELDRKYLDKDRIIDQLEIDKQDLRKAKETAEILIARLIKENDDLKAALKAKKQKT
jgi:transcriptional regulator with XRE-family HTH domain